MWKYSRTKYFFTSLILLAGFINLSPVSLNLYRIRDARLVRADWPSAAFPVFSNEPRDMTFILNEGNLKVSSPGGEWQSPEGWIVQQAAWTDLNHDNQPELALLVRRPFKPWPVDKVLPYAGRINNHQDSDGMSSHIILICWKKDHWGELWAGSALARPVRSFSAADINRDGIQELIVREGTYQDADPLSSSTLAVWQWNGFGFDLHSRIEKPSRRLTAIMDRENNGLIMLQ